MNDVYTALRNHQQTTETTASSAASMLFAVASPTTVTKNRPFQIMLHAYSHIQPDGPQALSVLQDWDETLQGDLEQAPVRRDYHRLLRAYAATAGTAATARKYDVLAQSLEGADICLETVKRLQQEWHTTMRPNVQTWALATVCLGRALDQLAISKALSDDDNAQRDSYAHYQKSFQDVQREFASEWTGIMEQWGGLAVEDEEEDGTDTLSDTYKEIIYWSFEAQEEVWKHDVVPQSLPQRALVFRFLVQLAAQSENPALFHQVMNDAAAAMLKHCSELGPMQLEDDIRTEACELVDTAMEAIDERAISKHYFFAIKARNSLLGKDLTDERILYFMDRIQEAHNRTMAHLQAFSAKERTRSCNDLMRAYFELEIKEKVVDCWDEMAQNPLIQPDVLSFSLVLKALTIEPTPGDAEKAHKIWELLVSEKFDAHPTEQHYGFVMTAFARSKHPHSIAICRKVMDRLREDQKKNPNLHPTAVHFSILISSYSKGGDVDSLLKCVEELSQSKIEWNDVLYANAISSLSKTHTEKGARKAEELLDEMKGNATALDYGAVMYGWSRSGSLRAAELCEAVYRRLVAAYEASNRQNPELQPNYSSCEKLLIYARSQNLYAWARSDLPDKAMLAGKLLEQMCRAYEQGESSIQPGVGSYVTVLNACAFTKTRDQGAQTEIVRLAVDTFAKMKSSVGCNEEAYRQFFNVLGWHVNDQEDRRRFLRTAFEQCRQDGLVSFSILRIISNYDPSFQQLMGRAVPFEWRRRLKKK